MKVSKEIRLFFSENIKDELGEIFLSDSESHHLIKVLRSNAGDEINLTNGKGLLIGGNILDANKKKVIINVTEVLEKRANESDLTIAISPTKSIDRFEWFLEKATEIGVKQIVPFVGYHSERKNIKLERLNKIIESAMKQSGRLWKPEITSIKSFSDVMGMNASRNKFIAHCHDREKAYLKAKVENPLILIGPEGGFSEKEIQFALENKFLGITLGDYRLRSETAGIIACQMVSEN